MSVSGTTPLHLWGKKAHVMIPRQKRHFPCFQSHSEHNGVLWPTAQISDGILSAAKQHFPEASNSSPSQNRPVKRPQSAQGRQSSSGVPWDSTFIDSLPWASTPMMESVDLHCTDAIPRPIRKRILLSIQPKEGDDTMIWWWCSWWYQATSVSSGPCPRGGSYLRGYMFLFFGKYMFLVGSDMFLWGHDPSTLLLPPWRTPPSEQGASGEVGGGGEEGRGGGEFAPEIRGSEFPLQIWVRACKRFGERVGKVVILFGTILIFVYVPVAVISHLLQCDKADWLIWQRPWRHEVQLTVRQ